VRRGKDPKTEFAVLLLRLWLGLNLAFAHGLDKFRDPDTFLAGGLVQRFPWPDTLGWVAILSEFVGGLLLTFGLLTRTAASFLLATMLGAALVALAGEPWGQRELAFGYALGLVLLLLLGPGALSLDGAIEKRRRSRSPW